jgi:hypothetical protein
MRYVNVDDQYVSEILEANKLQKSSNLNESEVIVEEQHEEEVHACPLCESELDEPISEESLAECVDYIAAVLEEAALLEGEMLEEADNDDEDDDNDEDEDEDDDNEDGEDNQG